jgi:hypothetical protein
MIYGDQWDCRCGWSNLFVRKRCRNCGEDRGSAPTVPFEDLVADIEAATTCHGVCADAGTDEAQA